MYKKIEDFLTDWESEKTATSKVFANITDESLDTKISEDARALGRLAWHITTSVGEMGHTMGLQIEKLDDQNDIPVKAVEIVDLYNSFSNLIAELVKKELTDESLDDIVDAYGQKWTKKFMLDVLIKHQIHHRGQLTMLMRKAGLKVPGVYGPSRDEWVEYGREPLK